MAYLLLNSVALNDTFILDLEDISLIVCGTKQNVHFT